MKENLAFIKVLQKIGMIFLKDRPCGNEAGLVFHISKDDFYKYRFI
jgi:hypothetical protein